MIQDPMSVFAVLALLVGVIFWLSGRPELEKLFALLPPVIFVYFVPMLLSTAGITPLTSPVYDWLSTYLLPLSLFLLMMSVDLKAVASLGGVALAMVCAGTAGIVIGGPISYVVLQGFLPDDAWQGLAALSGSWIGGTANMLAIKESVGASDATLAPILVVDTVVGYGWMAVLLLMSGWQALYDGLTKARLGALEDTNRRMAAIEERRDPITIRDGAFLLGISFSAAVLSVRLGNSPDLFPDIGDPTVISGTTWAVLIVVTLGLLLSLTRLQEYERVGASRLGYVALYLLLASIGARADLTQVMNSPAYLAAGGLWIVIHITILFGVAYLIRAPLFFVATGSMANIGGAVSAPIVAGVYHKALAPVGLLMAVVGYILGIYAAVFCAWLLSLVGG